MYRATPPELAVPADEPGRVSGLESAGGFYLSAEPDAEPGGVSEVGPQHFHRYRLTVSIKAEIHRAHAARADAVAKLIALANESG